MTHTNADTLQVTTTTSSSGTPTPIDWGPNGHPIRIPLYIAQPSLYVPMQSGFLTLHWDGDVILFVTDDSGNVVDFRIGLDGDVTPRDPNFTGLTVYGRDAAGVIVQSSNTTGSTGFNPLDPSTTSGVGASGTAGFKAPNVPAQYVRSDGFAVANGIQINGVRAFDSNLGAWTTPDAFEGDIHDPASQQKYMWNRGNPVDYSDPSGYETGPAFRDGWYTPDSESRWRALTPAEIRTVKERVIEDPHGKGTKPSGSRDELLIDQHGNLGVGKKGGKGEVEPLGSNIHDEPGGGQMRSKPKKDDHKTRNRKKRGFFPF